MDREAWCAVHRVAKSQTQLSDFHLRREERKNLNRACIQVFWQRCAETSVIMPVLSGSHSKE